MRTQQGAAEATRCQFGIRGSGLPGATSHFGPATPCHNRESQSAAIELTACSPDAARSQLRPVATSK